ncbi:MAG: hypothetical protein ABEK59_08325 [Halobacteria archaeon]
MSSLEGRPVALQSKDMVRLLQMGVVIEEYAEEKSAYMLADAFDGTTRNVLDESREESMEHRDMLLELIERHKSREIDEDRIESLVKKAIESTETRPESRNEALSKQRDSEMLAYSFYDNVVEALENYETDEVDETDEEIEEVIETVKEIREDELEDAQKLEGMLDQDGGGKNE